MYINDILAARTTRQELSDVKKMVDTMRDDYMRWSAAVVASGTSELVSGIYENTGMVPEVILKGLRGNESIKTSKYFAVNVYRGCRVQYVPDSIVVEAARYVMSLLRSKGARRSGAAANSLIYAVPNRGLTMKDLYSTHQFTPAMGGTIGPFHGKAVIAIFHAHPLPYTRHWARYSIGRPPRNTRQKLRGQRRPLMSNPKAKRTKRKPGKNLFEDVVARTNSARIGNVNNYFRGVKATKIWLDQSPPMDRNGTVDRIEAIIVAARGNPSSNRFAYDLATGRVRIDFADSDLAVIQRTH